MASSKPAGITLADTEVRLKRDQKAIRAEMAAIKAADSEGKVKAEVVVERATDPDNPLHPYFLWDDTAAAHQHRLTQARALIRTIEVVMPDDQSETFVPKYISLYTDRKQEGGGYRETKDVLKSKKLITELEETARRDIAGVLRRYEMLKDLCARVRAAAGIKPDPQPRRRPR